MDIIRVKIGKNLLFFSILALFLLDILLISLVVNFNAPRDDIAKNIVYNQPDLNKNTGISPSPIATPVSLTIPQSYTIPLQKHIYQSFNNCGPASLSMALSYYGINISQQELGNELRPYQVSSGDNDDKSVTLEELADKAEELGFKTYHRPNGDMQLLKAFIANDIPVITRTWTNINEDIGHYRLVRGYSQDEIIQDDSLQGKNIRYTYSEFNQLWEKFNYEYLVLIPDDKQEISTAILGEDKDKTIAWQNAVELSKAKLADDPGDIYSRFNLSVAYYNTGNYQKSVDEYEKVEHQLPFRTLWYQIEPIQAYYNLGEYDRVFEITDRVLNNHNRAFSELYILRGKIYEKRGNIEAARSEYEKAVYYNSELAEARNLLRSL